MLVAVTLAAATLPRDFCGGSLDGIGSFARGNSLVLFGLTISLIISTTKHSRQTRKVRPS